MEVKIKISIGELVDKITILEINPDNYRYDFVETKYRFL